MVNPAVDINFIAGSRARLPRVLATQVETLSFDLRSYHEPLHRAIKLVLAPSIRKNFDSGGRPNKWKPLSERTVARKGHGTILVDKGILRRKSTQINAWKIDRVEARFVGHPDTEFKMRNQFGFKFKNAKVPPRPFALIQPEDEENIGLVFDEWLAERIARRMK